MNLLKNIKITLLACTILAVALVPHSVFAQRFNHGGGPGRGAGGSRPIQPQPQPRQQQPERGSINGGGRGYGNHTYRVPDAPSSRPGAGYGTSEHVYHHYEGGHGYSYHPYHPHVWGQSWHPFGYFANTLARDAFFFTIASQNYYYDNGVYYMPYNGGYSVVAPPIGAVVAYLPAGYVAVMVGSDTYYYYGGAFYVNQGNGFMVVQAPLGAVVYELPEGAVEQNINGQNYMFINNAYFLPIEDNGQDAYEVVQPN